MPDKMSKAARSRTMAAIKSRNTRPERVLQRVLSEAHIVFETHPRRVPGTPDIVIHWAKVAVLVDGDFWHGWRYSRWRHKLNDYWRAKIDRNIHRDEDNRRKLREAGWTVVRVWEHQLERDPQACLTRIAKAAGLR